MKTTAVTLCVCFVAFAASLISHSLTTGKKEMGQEKEARAYILDVEEPFGFLRKHLPHARDKVPSNSLATDAIDAVSVVRVRRGALSADVEVELISGVQMDTNEYYILLAGTPATLDDTYSLALSLCELAKLPNNKIVAWHEKIRRDNELTSPELQTGPDGERRHSVNVRSSLELDSGKRWRVVYTIYFHGAGRPSGGEEDKTG